MNRQPAPIPVALWKKAVSDLEKKKTAQENGRTTRKVKNWKKKPPFLLRHLTYNLTDRKFVKCNSNEVSNLFFEYGAATGEDVSSDYIIVQMDDEDTYDVSGGGRNSKESVRTSFCYDVDGQREMILRNGILGFRNDEEEDFTTGSLLYNFLGSSNSQVQRHSYIFRRSDTLRENEAHLLRVLPTLRELERKKGIPKRVKYTGLLFSGITAVCLPQDEEVIVEEIPSRTNDKFDFTDGPGLISLKLARWVHKQLDIGGGCPSVYQIRYCGKVAHLDGKKGGSVCKGVLLVDPTNNETYKIQVRASMLKIPSSEKACSILQTTLGICDWSRPSPGRLGQQLICLLSGVVEKEDFMNLQQRHLACIKDGLHDPFSMAWMLALDRKKQTWLNFHKLLLEELANPNGGSPQRIPPLFSKCANAVEFHQARPDSEKVQLPLAASRNLFGAVFPEELEDFLEEGECIVLLEEGPLHSEVSCATDDKKEVFVLVSRSPSYHPGDVRVLRVVALPDNHPVNGLRNCILFSTKGERPDPDKMGGGDLDGDKYLVIWHPVFLKYANTLKEIEPARYDAGIPTKGDGLTLALKSDWIHYSALTDNRMLGEVETTFYKLAKKFGINSEEIDKLNALFASLVDRIPTSLDAFKELKGALVGGLVSSPGECVWEEMAMLQNDSAGSRRRFQYLNETQKMDKYRSFSKHLSDISKNPANLVMKMTSDFSYHFLESLRRSDVLPTMDALVGLSKSKNKTVQPENESRRFTEDGNSTTSTATKDDQSWMKERSKKESKELSEFERRARKLFQQPLAAVAKEKEQPRQLFDLHMSRKEDLCRKRDGEILSHEQRINDISHKCDQAVKQTRSWLEGRRRHWDTLETKARDSCWKTVATLKAKLQEEQLSQLERDLLNSDTELGSMWYLVEMWSATKREAAERNRNIRCQIRRLKDVHYNIRGEVFSTECKLKVELNQLVTLAKQEREQKEKSLEEELRGLEKERNLIEMELELCKRRYDDLITGNEKERLLEREEGNRSMLCILQAVVERIEQGEAKFIGQWDLPSLKGEMDALSRELEDIKCQAESLFCPEALKESERSIQESNEKEGSISLGLGHVLHELERAKLRWDQRLKLITSPTERCKDWKDLMKSLERVFTLEENRLLGFPRKGKRKGPMPVYYKRAELKRLMCTGSSQAVVVTAGTGCGKSTQIPQYIADDFYLYRKDRVASERDSPVRICCTQPRRVAAQKLAGRVAEEYLTEVGKLVGFKVGSRGRSREESVKLSNETVIEFVTEGLLLFNLARSPGFVQQYDAIVIDEAHERNAEQDLCLSLLRDYLSKSESLRPSFKVVVMSASIDPEKFCNYLHGCPAMDCPGRNFRVDENYLPLEESDPATSNSNVVRHAVDVLFENIVDDDKNSGDVLIFLSGKKEIDECVAKIRERAAEAGDLVVAYPLYSNLEHDSITAATNPKHRVGLHGEMSRWKKDGNIDNKEGNSIRKVICATNIAETSLTIDGVRFVIESGLARKVKYNHVLRCSVLSESRISRASAIQRKGRAGRTASGWCYYLYSKSVHMEEMDEYDTPKILEKSVDSLILLSLHVCGKSVEQMGLLDAPGADDIRSAKKRLLDLDLVKESESSSELALTESGRLATALPSLRPESIRMILTACVKYPHCTKRAINLAVLMSNDSSIFDKRLEVHEEEGRRHLYGDHLLALQHLEWFEDAYKIRKARKKTLKKRCMERGLDFSLLEVIQEDVEVCHKELKRRKLYPAEATKGAADDRNLLRILLSGYFHHVVKCIEPEFIQKLGCEHLGLNVTLFLDKDSSLQDALPCGRREASFVDDLEPPSEGGIHVADEEQNLNSNCFNVIREEVRPSFLLYGRLFATREKNFMLDASVIEGDWIAEETPKRWLARVSFDSDLSNVCRATITHIGPSLLSECRRSGTINVFQEGQVPLGRSRRDAGGLLPDYSGGEKSFFKELKSFSGVDALLVDFKRGIVRINGTQNAVDVAQSDVRENLLAIITRRCHRDQSHNKETGLRFSSGMEVVDLLRGGENNRQLLGDFFRAYGTDEAVQQRGTGVAVTMVNSKSALSVCPVRGCRFGLVQRFLKDLTGFTVSVQKNETLFLEKSSDYVVKPGKNHPRSKAILTEAAKIILKKQQQLTTTIDLLAFSNKQATMVVKALSHEASRASLFWDNFRESLISNAAVVYFLQSQESFKIFGEKNEELAAKFKMLSIGLSKALQYHQVSDETECGFLRYQVRRFASILAELKKRCPKVLFHLVDVTMVGDEVESNTGFHSDYVWLMQIAKTRKIQSIRLCFTALGQQDRAQAARLLREKLCGSALIAETTPKIDNDSSCTQRKECVMCRRVVLVRLGKSDSKRKLNIGDGLLEGWNLTLCGCCYCRECFRSAVSETLADDIYRSAKCLCCKRIVLSKDCFEIFCPKEKGPISRANTEEWNQFCRLAEAKCCESKLTEFTNNLRPGKRTERQRGWTSCPDCGISMVYPGGYCFAICRNRNCRIKTCTRCCQVASSESDFQRCVANHCKAPHSE